jgi:diguanylate cyclase (GGDEF)-like protein
MVLDCVVELEKLSPMAEEKEDFFKNLLETIKDVFFAEGCLWLRKGKYISVGIDNNFNLDNIKNSTFIEQPGEFGGMIIINPDNNILNTEMLVFLNLFLQNIELLIKLKNDYEEKLTIDSLTNVSNMTALNNRITNTFLFNKVGVLYVDINGLGVINNMYGHAEGDVMIKTIAKTIAHFFRKQDIYRKGGDEFIVICTDIDEELFKNKIELIKEELATTKYSASFGYSYGVNVYDIEALMDIADQRMCIEKENYRENNVSKYKVKRVK